MMITHAILANAAGTQYIDNGSCQGHYTCYNTLDSIGKGSWYENTNVPNSLKYEGD